jgi:hypothetical protein
MMEAARTSTLHGATTQKTAIFDFSLDQGPSTVIRHVRIPAEQLLKSLHPSVCQTSCTHETTSRMAKQIFIKFDIGKLY